MEANVFLKWFKQKYNRLLLQLDQNYVDHLVLNLKSENKDARKNFIEKLESKGWQPINNEQQIWQTIAHQNWEKCQQFGLEAVEPLLYILRNDLSYLLRLKSYEILERISIKAISQEDQLKLAEEIAAQIRLMYSRTYEVTEDTYTSGGAGSLVPISISHTGHDPDVNGILELKNLIPLSLIEDVEKLSGEAKKFFQ